MGTTIITIKNLANGQLPNSKGTLYTVPASTQAVIKSITLYNTNTTAETVALYILKSAGTSRQISTGSLVASGGFMIDDTEYTLGAGDIIQGNTTTASKVDFVISGIEES
jgi:hypothetical protein